MRTFIAVILFCAISTLGGWMAVPRFIYRARHQTWEWAAEVPIALGVVMVGIGALAAFAVVDAPF